MPTTDRNYMNVLWGKLASEILMQDWDNALDDLTRLREVLDSNVCISLRYRFTFCLLSYNLSCNMSVFRGIVLEVLAFRNCSNTPCLKKKRH